MKKIYLLLVAFFVFSISKAQVSTYSFAESAGSYSVLGGTNSTATGDDGSQNGLPIGFNFVMGGTTFTHFCINTNGWIRLGTATTTITTSSFTNDLSNAAAYRPLIAALWDDNHRNSGAITYSLTGTTPNQVLTVDWNNVNLGGGGSTSATNLASFQIKIYETTNIIEIIYGNTLALAGTLTASIGLNDNTSFLSVTPGSPSGASGLSANNSISSTTNLTGKKFTFSPPPPCSGTPLTPTVPAAAGFCLPSGSVTVTAGNPSTGTGINYQWEESDDNGVGDAWANAVGGSGATTMAYTSPVLSAVIYYRLRVTCTNGGGTVTSSATQASPVNCSFNVTRTSTSFTSIAGTGTSATAWRNGNNTDDNMSTAQPIGFTFNYKGVDYSQFLVSTSGFITFNTATAALGNGTGAYGYQNTNLSSTTGTLNAIAPFYEDQVTPGNPTTAAGLANAMKYQVTGSSPNRVLTVEWIGMETFNNAGPNLNYQVKLYETSNVVEFVYGTMELFNGTADFGYSYTVGLNAATVGASPTIAQLQSQQADNEQNFANVAKNDLDRFIDCNIKYVFTPGAYSGAATPTSITNDEPANPVVLGVNNSPCTNLCGTYYTSNGATASAGITTCSAAAPGTPDDDVWFRFTASTAQQTITVKGGGGYDAVVQLFSDAGITSVACVNATGAGLTETINATTLTPGGVYYVRVYHAGTGSNNANTALPSGNVGGGVPDFSICVNEVVPPPGNDNPCGSQSLTVANGTCTGYSDNVIGGKTQFVTATNTTLNGVITPICSGAGAAQDVWFSFVAPNCNSMIIKTTPVAGVNTAFEVDSVVSGTCGGANLVLGVKSCTNIASTGQVDSLIFTSFVPGNTYYVRVYHHPSGQGGAPVSGSQFSICLYTPATPSCTINASPTDAATNVSVTPTLSWAAAAGASSYDVYLSTINPPTTLVANVTGTSYVVSPALSYTTTYYWYVVPKNCSGAATGCVSNVTSFTTTTAPPANDECSGAITVTTQANAPTCSGTTAVNTTSATLSTNTSVCWSTSNNDDVWYSFVATNSSVVINVSNYLVTSGTAPDLAYVLYNDSMDCSKVNSAHELTVACPVITPAGGNGTATFSGLIAGNTYTLRLFTSGSGNSASFNFCLMDPPIPPTCTTNLAPANGATNLLTPIALSWNTAATATSYTIFIGTTNPPTALDSLTTLTATSFTLNSLASNTTYYWFVTPKNAGGAATGCNTNTTSFTTGIIFCVPTYTNNLCPSGGDSLSYFSLKGESGTAIYNASGASCGATSPNYSNYTGIGSVSMYPSKSYSGKLKGNSGFSEGVSMWIDYDNNGTFDSTEKVLNHLTVAPADGFLNYSIHIPAGSATGSHRLRVRSVFGNAGVNISPCNNYGYGETEDYTVNILSGAATPYTVSIPPSPGVCVTGGVMTIDALSNNNNGVIPMLDSFNNIIASANAGGQDLGRVTTEYYLHNSNGGPNTRGGVLAGPSATPKYYLDRNLRISVATQPVSPVNVRMFISAADLANYNVVVPSTTAGLLDIDKTNQNTCATAVGGDSLYIIPSGSGSLGSNYFIDFSTPSFSNFYAYRSNAVVIPVKIINVYGRATGTSNTVYWTTAQEQDSRKFIIERSTNGRDFTSIGETPTKAPGGYSNISLDYSFADVSPVTGKTFYRLRMVDNNGHETVSPIVTILRGGGKLEITDIRPNPTSSRIYFNVIGGNSTSIELVVRTIQGKEVMRKTMSLSNGLNVDMSALAAGVYMLEVTDRNNEKVVFKAVKQ